MVATKALISLCVVGLALGQRQVDQGVIVTNVVTALQPSIAEAVANALRNLGGSSTGFAAGSSFGASQAFNSFGSSSRVGTSSAGASSGALPKGPVAVTARPEYSFEFQVADDDKQTYITQNEERDGDDVTGSYSYVDPLGSLITVNYQAGTMGFTQTVDTKEGAVQIKNPSSSAGAGTAQAFGASGSAFNSNSNIGSSSAFNSNSNTASSSAFNSNSNTASSSAFNSNSANNLSNIVSSSSLDQSALIAQILSALQPQISQAVNSAISTQSSFSRGTGAVQAGQLTKVNLQTSGAISGDRLTPLFGN